MVDAMNYSLFEMGRMWHVRLIGRFQAVPLERVGVRMLFHDRADWCGEVFKIRIDRLSQRGQVLWFHTQSDISKM